MVSMIDTVLGGTLIVLGTFLAWRFHLLLAKLDDTETKLANAKRAIQDSPTRLDVAKVKFDEMGSLSRLLDHMARAVEEPLTAIGCAAWLIQQRAMGDPDTVCEMSEHIVTEVGSVKQLVADLIGQAHAELAQERSRAAEIETLISRGSTSH